MSGDFNLPDVALITIDTVGVMDQSLPEVAGSNARHYITLKLLYPHCAFPFLVYHVQ